MLKSTTAGIQISAKARYEPSYSAPKQRRFIFSYRITIENKSLHPFQLLRRTWEVFDSNGVVRTVEGKGVIGEQPIIKPGSSYTYNSACDLETEYGSMSGSYLMINKDSQDFIHAQIPMFQLATPWILN